MLDNTLKRAYSVDEVGAMLGLGRVTIYSEIANGNLQSYKVGQRRLIPAKAVDDWEKKKLKESNGRAS